MNAPDEFSRHYAELIEGVYDYVDRIVVNVCIPMGQTGGGMRSWWRRLRGDDSTLDDAHLREMAGIFSWRVRAYCGKQGIPLMEVQAGEHKHEWSEEFLPGDPGFRCVFLVITGNAPASVWEVKRHAAHHLSVSHNHLKGRQRNAVLKAPLQAAQPPCEPGHHAAVEFPEAPMVWVALRLRFFRAVSDSTARLPGRRGRTSASPAT